MTPDQLAKSGTEHGEQRALFGWIKYAMAYGFAAAWDDESYSGGLAKYLYDGPCQDFDMQQKGSSPVAELEWCHAIPNGGLRDKVTAAKLKHEGVKKGIADVFLPLPMAMFAGGRIKFAGLYLELKRPEKLTEGERKAFKIEQRAGVQSPEQIEFQAYCKRVGYAYAVCTGWREAALNLQTYIEAVRKNAA